MMKSINKLNLLAMSVLAASSTFVQAQELALPNLPLSLISSVPPNVQFVVDDSGSMDWEILAQPHFAACNYYNPNNYTNCPSTKYETGLYYYSYPDAASSSFYNLEIYNLYDLYNAYTNYTAIFFPNLINEDFRIYDSDFNAIYYNPDVDYTYWKGPCSYVLTPVAQLEMCHDADYTSARANPKEGLTDYNIIVNLDNDVYNSVRHVHSYVVNIDDKGYTGTAPTGNNMTTTPNNEIDVWDSHAIIKLESASSIVVELYRTNTSTLTKELYSSTTLGANTCYDILGSKSYVQEVLNGTRSIDAKDASGCRTIAEVRQNYANWFQYHRRRSYTARSVISQIVDLYSNFRYGMNMINELGIKTPVPDNGADLYTHNLTMLHNYFNDGQRRYGTPLAKGLYNTGRYYQGLVGTPPIIYDCQLNHAVVLTDGYYNGTHPPFGDIDGDGYGIYDSTIADIARYYYINDLDTNLADNVLTSSTDPNNQQHLNMSMITLGMTGNLIMGVDGWPDPSLTYNSDWGDPFSCAECPEKVDDLWHAAFNSHALFIPTSNISSLLEAFESIFQLILTSNKASGSSAATSSTLMTQNLKVYQATFDASKWTGELSAYSVGDNGSIDTDNPVFQASTLLNQKTADSRVIINYNSDKNTGAPFRYSTSNFANHQRKSLTQYKLKFIKTGGQVVEKDIVNYLRGDHTNEVINDQPFRTRTNILGDIIHSAPLHIGTPSLVYSDQSYIDFKNSLANRTPMVAIGANDGMLHIFHGDTGEELMAYVPGQEGFWSHLGELADPNYEHRFYVDGPISTNDVYLNTDNAWHTILVGNLGLGGQGLYALDVTEGLFSEASATTISLFEFNDNHDKDMGNSLSTPQIVKMNNDKWAIIIGNGYNATKSTYQSGAKDTYVSTSKQAALFILFIEDGIDGTWTINQDYIKILVGDANDNGLAEPFPIDVNGDYKVDYIYAGDLNGKLYKFDVTDSSPTNWKNTDNVTVLFDTPTMPEGKQVITTPLTVGPHPDGISKGMMIYFGTGKYIEADDDTSDNQPTQSFYGIWDENIDNQQTIVGTSSLYQQEILASNDTMRATTDYHNIDWTVHKGWYINLEENGNNYGERVIGAPVLRNSRIIFTTVLPGSGTGSCSATANTGWLMELNANDGSRLSRPAYDMNRDGIFSEADYMTFTNPYTNQTVNAPPSGSKSEVGVIGGAPSIISEVDNSAEYKVLSGSTGITTIKESTTNNIGRQSWQELY